MNESIKLKEEILELENQLEEKRDKFFKLRLYKLLGIAEQQLETYGVTDLVLNIYEDEWEIVYKYTTAQFDENDYNHGDDSNEETEIREKTANITFGESGKLFISGKGIRSSRFKMYRNSRKEMRVINTDYSIELGTEEQLDLIRGYTQSKKIPEWLALSVFLYMCDNEWDTENIIQYLGTV